MNELKYTLKLISKNIRFSLLCISVIAIGVGIIVPFYSFVHNVSGKELPLDQGDRYVTFKKEVEDRSQILGVPRYDVFHYNYFKENSTSFDFLEAWQNVAVSISDGEYSESYIAAEIEPYLLQVTGIQPVLGRLFTEQDTEYGSEQVAILSFQSWQTYYTAREDIIGHQSRINGVTRTIIGVMPEDFTFPISHDLWMPLSLPRDVVQGEGLENLALVGFLADNVDMSQASSEIQLLQSQIKASWPDEYSYIESSEVVPYSEIGGGETVATEILFIIMVLLITLNAGNLFFVRGEERLQELAIRSALGADHRRIAQALMLESFLVIFIGLLFGLALAQLGLNSLDQILTNAAPSITSTFWWDMSINMDILATSLLVTTLVWLVSGGLPAWRISRINISEYISQSGKGLTEGGATRINKILVNSQLVISCALLTMGAFTILVNSNTNLVTFRNSESLYTGYINFTSETFSSGRTPQAYRLNLQQSLAQQSGIDGVTFTTDIPGGGGTTVAYSAEDQDLAVNEIYPRQYAQSVSPGYFEMLAIELLQGREFGDEDEFASLPVAIVDQRLVDLLWPDESPLGKRIQVNPEENSPWVTIVGVAEPRFQEGIVSQESTGTPVLYRPLNQTNPFQFSVIFNSQDPGLDYQRVLRRAASGADRDIPIVQIQSFSQIEESRESNLRLNLNIGLIFMLIALYLTGTTTYGLAARAAYRKRTEIGIRMALGARKIDCLRVILKDGFSAVVIGLGLGGALAILGSYAVLTLTPLPIGTLEALIPLTLIVCLLMGGLVMLANYFPARKIVAMEPGEALHYE